MKCEKLQRVKKYEINISTNKRIRSEHVLVNQGTISTQRDDDKFVLLCPEEKWNPSLKLDTLRRELSVYLDPDPKTGNILQVDSYPDPEVGGRKNVTRWFRFGSKSLSGVGKFVTCLFRSGS